MSIRSAVIGAAMLALLSGCATKTVPLESSVGSQYRGKTITYSVHKSPDFSAMTAGKASMGAFGAIGGALAGESMQSAGNKIIAQNEVTDPAPTIGITLATDLANKYGLKLVHPATAASGKKLAQVAQTYAQQADLVLDVQTRGWGFSYFPVDWNNYYIFYGAKLKLIDTKATEEIAVSSFMYDSKDESNPPSKDQLLANNATVLKQKITTAQNQCIYETRQRIFNAN